MDDENNWLEDKLLSALNVALDRLEVLDPKVRQEYWFKYLDRDVDARLTAQLKNGYH